MKAKECKREQSSKKWFVYMVRCADGSLYTGIAKDVIGRTTSPPTSRYHKSPEIPEKHLQRPF